MAYNQSSGNTLNTTKCAFCVYLASTVNNKTGAGANYNFGTDALTKLYDHGLMSIVTTAATYRLFQGNFAAMAVSGATLVLSGSIFANMTAGDTAIVKLLVAGGAKDVDVTGATNAAFRTPFFGGHLVC